MILKRKFHKICNHINCDRLQKMWDQDVISEHLSFKKCFLRNGPIPVDDADFEPNEVQQLFSGDLQKKLSKVTKIVQDHIEQKDCCKVELK
jgi:hypothetical protein